jgi:type II secretory pathway predicted ATPase ExeA
MTGEIGTGKTTLLRMLMTNLEANVRFAYLYNTTLGFEDLLAYACDELGISAQGEGRLRRIQALNAFLIEQLRRGGTGVLLIDEAQNLAPDVLENLRLLSNLETSTEKLLQIVLVGQPELEAKLAQPGLRQLRQRIALRCRLDRLKESEVEAYIRSRLETAGARKADLFEGRALQRIVAYSSGVPRLINIICDNALVIAYAASAKRVSPAIVEEVASDLGLNAAPPRPPAVALEARPTPSEAPAPIEPRSTPPIEPRSTAPIERRSTAEILRRRGLRRAPGRRWLGWARLGVLTAFVAVGSATLLYAPSITEHISAMRTSMKSAWGDLAERATLARHRTSAASTPVRPLPDAGVTEDAGRGREPLDQLTQPVGHHGAEGVTAPTLPAATPTEPAASAPALSLPPRPSNPPLTSASPVASAGHRAITIPGGATIADLAFRIYGGYNVLAIDLIKEFNPQVENLNSIRAGEQLQLPSLDAETLIRKQPNGHYRLIIGSFLSSQAAERMRVRLRRAGYEATITTRRLTDHLEVHRVELTELPTRDVARKAWETALANCWLAVAEASCEEKDHG